MLGDPNLRKRFGPCPVFLKVSTTTKRLGAAALCTPAQEHVCENEAPKRFSSGPANAGK